MRGLKREPKDNIIAESLPEIVPGRFCEDSSKGTDLPEIFLQKNLGQRAFARTRADGPPVTDPPARPTCTWEELLTIIRQAVYEISQRVHGHTNRGRNCRLTGIYRSLRRWQRCTHTHMDAATNARLRLRTKSAAHIRILSPTRVSKHMVAVQTRILSPKPVSDGESDRSRTWKKKTPHQTTHLRKRDVLAAHLTRQHARKQFTAMCMSMPCLWHAVADILPSAGMRGPGQYPPLEEKNATRISHDQTES